MKCARLAGPQTIELRDVPDPRAPRDGLVLAVECCGICGSDIRRWREGPPAGEGDVVPGHEISGHVAECGPEETRFRVGDRLAVAPDIHCGECWHCRRGLFNLCGDLQLLGITPGLGGGFAERVVLPGRVLRNGVVHRMPEGLSFREGALAETLASVLAAHEKCRTRLGETVVVLGAGPLGCLHLAVARARGARTVACEPSPARRAYAETFEPERVIDPSSEDPVAAVARITEGLGADVVISAAPSAAALSQAVEMARAGGRVVLFGGLPKASPVATLDANRIHYGERQVLGSFSYHPSFHEEALRTLERGIVKAEEIITHVFPLSRIAEAFPTAASGEALKVMVEPG